MDLAREGTEVEWVLKNSVAGEARIGRRGLARSGLRSLIQEYHFCTIYCVRLNQIHSYLYIYKLNKFVTIALHYGSPGK